MKIIQNLQHHKLKTKSKIKTPAVTIYDSQNKKHPMTDHDVVAGDTMTVVVGGDTVDAPGIKKTHLVDVPSWRLDELCCWEPLGFPELGVGGFDSWESLELAGIGDGGFDCGEPLEPAGIGDGGVGCEESLRLSRLDVGGVDWLESLRLPSLVDGFG
jgi:hypothetical protein